MSGLNYLANALLIDSVDKVRNKLLAAWNYGTMQLSIDYELTRTSKTILI